MKLKTYLLVITLSFTSISLFAQDDSTFLSLAVSSLSGYCNSRPVEKVYLHLDRSYYIPGDTVWFKAYTVIGQLHQLSALSGVLYCELINDKDSVINRHTIKLMVGLGWGDFGLPRALKPGNYHIRAYTNWMRNAGADYFYDQKIKIGGQQANPAMVNQMVQAKPDVQFFPEGGELVNGVRCRVAVKSVSANGLGEDIKGIITDNDGNEAAEFTTQHLGMGVFAMVPQAGKTYKAKITCADSSQYTIDLPAARETGFTLAVNNSAADSIYIKAAVNDKLFQERKNSSFYLLAQSGGKVYYTALGKLSGPVFTAQIAKSRFPSGIAQFTLFSQTGEPLNERIVFIQRDDTIKMALSTLAKTYSTRQKVKIDLDTKNLNNQTVPGSYSIAVINESRVPVNENAENTILNDLLLTSDIKGFVEQPNYYFINTNDKTRADLDVLMLTQGYCRFEWKQLLDTVRSGVAYLPERSLELAGSLKTPAGKPVPSGKITLAATRENVLIDTVTGADGNFKFTNLKLSDTTKIILRARKQHNGSNVAIYVKQADYPAVIKNSINTDTAFRLTPEMEKNITEYRTGLRRDSVISARHLKEVLIKDKLVSKPDIYNNYGTSLEYRADMKRLNREWINLSDGLALLIPGAAYINGKILYENHPARLIIDGLRRSNDDINLYSPQEIDNIRMISSTGTRPALLMITSKNYAGTDTASTVLKEVVIKDKKTEKPGPSNRYGTDHPYTISGSQLMQISNNLKMALLQTVHSVLYINGKLVTTNPKAPIHMPLYVVINDQLADQSELDSYSPGEIESVKVLVGGAYKSEYGIMGNSKISDVGAGKDNGVQILYVTTKQYAGTDTAKTINLKTVNIKSQKTAQKLDLTTSSNIHGGGNADQVIMGDQLGSCINLSDCLIGKIFGVTFLQDGTPMSTRKTSLTSSPVLSVIVDGNVLTGGHLNDINVSDIYSIEVLRSSFAISIYGSSIQGGGALVITMKHGASSNYVTSVAPAGLITYPFKGYSIARTFYSPRYDGPKTEGQSFDHRTTIYWKPNIITDKDGKASFEYFNADTKGTYRIVVEGIDDNGNLGRLVYRYKVE